MNGSFKSWQRLFLACWFYWSLALLSIVAIGLSIAHPLLFWLFTGTWEWLPAQKWLHAGLICIPGAMSAALLFIFGNWLDHGGASIPNKIGVGLLVFGSSFGIIFLGRKIVSYIVLISFGVST